MMDRMQKAEFPINWASQQPYFPKAFFSRADYGLWLPCCRSQPLRARFLRQWQLQPPLSQFNLASALLYSLQSVPSPVPLLALVDDVIFWKILLRNRSSLLLKWNRKYSHIKTLKNISNSLSETLSLNSQSLFFYPGWFQHNSLLKRVIRSFLKSLLPSLHQTMKV